MLCLQIAGYPTLKLFYDGEAQDTYRGEHTAPLRHAHMVHLHVSGMAEVCLCIAALPFVRPLVDCSLKLPLGNLGLIRYGRWSVGGRDLASMQDYLKQQKLSLLQETSA